MLTCWLLQGSLLVAPMTMGDEPPQTRAAAIVYVRGDRDVLARWRAQVSGDFPALAKRLASVPNQEASAAVGTFTRAMLSPPELAETLFDGGCRDSLEPVIGPIAMAGGGVFVQCLERDAACRQIFVAGVDDAAHAKTDAILRELRAGADFAKLAREKSDDRASALRGGDLAIFELSSSTPLRDAVFNARVGEIVGPIEDLLGSHIVQRVAVEQIDPRLRDDAWARARAISITWEGIDLSGSGERTGRTYEQAQALAEDLAARVRRGESMSELAREFDDDRGGREREGDVGWVRRATTYMPPFFDRLFVEPPGTLIGPIECEAGFVLVRREDPGPRSRIELRKNPFFVFERVTRRRSGEYEIAPETGALCEGAWTFEDAVVRSASAADFIWACERLPNIVALSTGGECALRTLAVEYARAIAPFERDFLEETWPASERTLEAATSKLHERLNALGEVAVEQMMRDFQMRDPRIVVPVYVFPGQHSESAIVRSTSGGSSCLAAVSDLTDNQELHVVLDLAANVLDDSTRDQDTVLSKLRSRLGASASKWPSRVQSLISAEASAVLHRVFDQDSKLERNVYGSGDDDYLHVDSMWRETSTELGRMYASVQAIWTSYLAGERSLEQALHAIAAEN